MHRKHWSLVLVLVLVLSLTSQAAMAQVANYTARIIVSDVTSGAAVVGGTFTTDISLSVQNNVDPAQLNVIGADVWICFDPAIVAVDDADNNPSNGTQVSVVSGFFTNPFVAANEVVSVNGQDCVHVAMSHSYDPVTDRTGKIATITWAGIAAGNPGFEVLQPDTILADANGADVPVNSVTVPSINVMAPGTINGKVLRQGTRTDHADTLVTAYNAGGGAIATTTTLPDGTFASPLAVPMGGNYLVQAIYNGYLRAQRSGVYVVGAAVNLGTITILGGDVNNDNNINILDIVTIISQYGLTGLPTTSAADINDDGTVNIYDLTLAAGNFGRYGPIAW